MVVSDFFVKFVILWPIPASFVWLKLGTTRYSYTVHNHKSFGGNKLHEVHKRNRFIMRGCYCGITLDIANVAVWKALSH